VPLYVGLDRTGVNSRAMEPVYKADRERRLGPVSSLPTLHTQLRFMLAAVLLESRRVDRGAPGCSEHRSEHRSLPVVTSELYRTIVLENNEIPVYEMVRQFLHTASEYIMPHHI
jgi:hypothetical protein